MNIRSVVVLVLSLMCGVSAAIGANLWIAGRKSAPAPAKTTKIVVAAVDVARGAPLQAFYLKTQDWPEANVPKGAIRDIEKVVDRVTLTPLVVGLPLLDTMIAEKGVGASALVRPGMRAFTIETPTNSSGVAGLLLPGNRVDVLLTIAKDDDKAAAGEGTWTLLQNVEILAAGQRLDQKDPKKPDSGSASRSVTLMVTPEMAVKLTLASTLGVLNLTLRNDTDTSIAETQPVTLRELMFLQEGIVEQPEVSPNESVTSTKMLVAPTSRAPEARREILVLRGTTGTLVQVGQSQNSTSLARSQ